jgi:tetrahydromethanopterin S-methyltransferase subunit F
MPGKKMEYHAQGMKPAPNKPPVNIGVVFLGILVAVLVLLSMGALIGYSIKDSASLSRIAVGFTQGCGATFAVLLIIPLISWISKKADS